MSAFGKFTLSDVAIAVKNILGMLQRPLWADPISGAVRQVAAVTTVTSLTTQVYVSAAAAPSAGLATAYDAMVINPMRMSYALNVRSRIKDT
jgi:hypothetical protein